MSGFISIGPVIASAFCSTGARVARIHFNRAMTSSLLAPMRNTLPRPSLRPLKARLPCLAFFTIHTGIEGQITPAIGPTASW